jgi:antitoxin (DNA-binding transcriptional repressor) of toxin-antitoxin stability system
MIEVSVTDAVNGFHRFLGKVERGETVRIRKHGRAFARIVPDSDFMSSADFTKIFADYKADNLDKVTADAIAANVRKMDEEFEHELAHRHGHSH